MMPNGLNNQEINLTAFMSGIPEIKLEADSRLDDGDLIHLGNLEFKVIHTPRPHKRRMFIIFR